MSAPIATVVRGYTRFVTRDAILNFIKQLHPEAYISGNSIIIPKLPDDWDSGDAYVLELTISPSYVP